MNNHIHHAAVRLVALGALLLMGAAASATTDDAGLVDRIFVSGSQFAVQLVSGFPHAIAAGECPTSNGWAGFNNGDPAMKATLLAAKASGQTVTLIISGCEAGVWWKVTAIYVSGG